MKTTRNVAVLLAALALQAAALAQPATPAPKPASPAVTEANASTAGPAKASPAATPGAPAQAATPGQPQAKPGEAAPAAQSGVQGVTQGARPPSGKPPVVVGPDGRAHAASVPKASTKVAMPGSRAAGNIGKPASRTIRVGVANSDTPNAETSTNSTTAVASIPLTSRISLASGAPTTDSQSVHTWTSGGTTFSADAAAPSGAGTAAGSVGNAISAGLLASSSVTNSKSSAKGAIPAGIVNDMLVRIGGMATQMSKQSTTASAAE